MSRKKNPSGPNIYWQTQAAQWCLNLAGRRYRLGTDEDAAQRRREGLLREHLRGRVKLLAPRSGLLVSEACRAYRDGVSDRYPLRSGQYHRIGTALDAVDELFGDRPAADFDSLALQAVRDHLLTIRSRRDDAKLLSRHYVNSLVGTVQTAWDWLAMQRLVPTEMALNLRTVKALRAGFGGVETPAVLPADPAAVEAALLKCNPVVRAMARLQLLTGMRPGEVVLMRRCDLSTTPAEVLRPVNSPPIAARAVGDVTVWLYAPQRHKTMGRGKPRLVALGPQAQEILLPFLAGRDPGAYLFSPRDGRRSWKGQPGKLSPGGRPGSRYTTQSYGRSVRYACARAGVAPWGPNQLRHSVASEIADRQEWDLAADVLGHATPSTTAVYVSRLLGRLAEYAARAG